MHPSRQRLVYPKGLESNRRSKLFALPVVSLYSSWLRGVVLVGQMSHSATKVFTVTHSLQGPLSMEFSGEYALPALVWCIRVHVSQNINRTVAVEYQLFSLLRLHMKLGKCCFNKK